MAPPCGPASTATPARLPRREAERATTKLPESCDLPLRILRRNIVACHELIDDLVKVRPRRFAEAVVSHDERSAGVELLVLLVAAGASFIVRNHSFREAPWTHF